jgi:pSer/pThr/pTyr-binding forkhead associated (FHA) protein
MRQQQSESGNLTLHLLDSAQGHPIQTWHFKNRTRVSIGRAEENDISLADTQVSRLHVELTYEDGKWQLRSHGRNGTRIDGAPVSDAKLPDRVIFQLASNGPTFQFVTFSDSVSNRATIDNIDPAALDFLAIDEQRKAQEVEQIVESDAFRQLQQQARLLKQENHAGESD